MPRQTFVNLPVRDVERSKEFFREIGLPLEPRFTDERAACVVLGENAYAMLLDERTFRTFTDKTVADAHRTTEVLIALSCASRIEVDETMSKALEAGGHEARETRDEGFVYGRSFEDPDGHVWELVYMTPSDEWQPVEGETRLGP